jgi:hypothetical protein
MVKRDKLVLLLSVTLEKCCHGNTEFKWDREIDQVENWGKY